MQAVWEAGGGRAAARGVGCVAMAVCSAPRSSSAVWLVQVFCLLLSARARANVSALCACPRIQSLGFALRETACGAPGARGVTVLHFGDRSTAVM